MENVTMEMLFQNSEAGLLLKTYAIAIFIIGVVMFCDVSICTLKAVRQKIRNGKADKTENQN